MAAVESYRTLHIAKLRDRCEIRWEEDPGTFDSITKASHLLALIALYDGDC